MNNCKCTVIIISIILCMNWIDSSTQIKLQLFKRKHMKHCHQHGIYGSRYYVLNHNLFVNLGVISHTMIMLKLSAIKPDEKYEKFIYLTLSKSRKSNEKKIFFYPQLCICRCIHRDRSHIT